MAKKIRIARRHTELPTPHFVTAIAEMERETPRGCAIAGTAFLDLALRTAIERYMRPIPKIQDALFEDRGPLQDFSARIQVAFALKIIGGGAIADLLAMRDIRNAFAHSAEVFDFDREDIAARCKSLWYPRFFQIAGRPKPTTPRQLFERGVRLLADGLIREPPTKGDAIPLPQAFILWGPQWPPPEKPQSSPKKRKLRVRQGDPAQS